MQVQHVIVQVGDQIDHCKVDEDEDDRGGGQWGGHQGVHQTLHKVICGNTHQDNSHFLYQSDLSPDWLFREERGCWKISYSCVFIYTLSPTLSLLCIVDTTIKHCIFIWNYYFPIIISCHAIAKALEMHSLHPSPFLVEEHHPARP